MTLRTLSGPAMGSRWTVRLDCDDAQAAALTDVCAQAVEVVEQQMSNWRTGSDLNRLNAAPLGEWVNLPPPFDECAGNGRADRPRLGRGV